MTILAKRQHYATPAVISPKVAQILWFGTGALLAFLVPFVFTDVIEFQTDLYYAVFFAFVGLFVTAYATRTHADLATTFRRRWRLSAAVGVLAAAFVVFSVLNRAEATARPDGAYLAFEVVWRGLLYGVVDAVLLTVFPLLVAIGLAGGRVEGMRRRAQVGLLALALTIAITATYHLGYEQYRQDGVADPELGNTIISVPAIVTLNPLGSLIAHSSMHTAAVLHAYETDIFLPPQTDAD